MGRLSLPVALLLALALPASVGATAVAIQNGSFTDAAGGIPMGWRVEAWNRDLTDVGWEPAPAGQAGASGKVRIVNRAANDARLCQSFPVTPGASYRVTAQVKTQDVGLTTAGALIAIEPRIADSVDIKGTSNWQTLEVTATNQDAATWDVCLRLGSYANLNTGTAWFSDVHVEQVSAGVAEVKSGWPSFTLAPVLVSLRQTPWMQTAVPLVGGLLLAFGLGIVGRRPR